ncbi:MAG TPA: hypothetical protein PLP29_01610 [Candidatus Ozemobacteraceae bacterium]|nr:hypothetical protein [Candidatus Ozemobacteraceae bacterium]
MKGIANRQNKLLGRNLLVRAPRPGRVPPLKKDPGPPGPPFPQRVPKGPPKKPDPEA